MGERYAIDFVAVDQGRRTAGGSSRVAVGDTVTAGQPIAQCGNSGNSTQPPRGSKQVLLRQSGLPGEGAVVEPLDQRTDLRL